MIPTEPGYYYGRIGGGPMIVIRVARIENGLCVSVDGVGVVGVDYHPDGIEWFGPVPMLGEPPMVYVVQALNSDGEWVTHIFSTREKAEAWADQDDRACVIFDYVVDEPEHHEGRLQ
jgi:hypothetical protein